MVLDFQVPHVGGSLPGAELPLSVLGALPARPDGGFSDLCFPPPWSMGRARPPVPP